MTETMRQSEGEKTGSRGEVGVALRDVSVRFGGPGGRGEVRDGVEAVRGVSLTIGAGEFVALLGPSGCGKSTLLRAVAGLQGVTSGRVEVGSAAGEGGKGWGGRRKGLERAEGGGKAFVFQEANLLPWRTVLRNVALPLELMGVGKRERLAAAEAALEQVGLGEAAGRYPAQLSGGMKMRCSLARALVTKPRLLLLDEPFAALDEITRHRLDETLRKLWRDSAGGLTVLFVTHSIPEAVFLAGRAVVFTRRPARVVLDREIGLGVDRPAEIRTEVAFARESRALHEALVRAEADEVQGAGEGGGR